MSRETGSEGTSDIVTRESHAAARRRWAVSTRPFLLLGMGALAVLAAVGAAAVDGAVPHATLRWLIPALIFVPGALCLLAARRGGGRRDGDETTRLLRGAFESMTVPGVIVAPDGRPVYANAAYHRMFGSHADAPPPALEAAFAADPDALDRIARVRRAAAEGKAGESEVRLVDASGREEWRNVQARPLAGHPGYVVLQVEDITARREMEHVIRDEQEKLFDFLENAPVGFYSVDADGRFLFINRTLAHWFGCTTEEILNGERRLDDFVVRAPGVPYDPFGGNGGDGDGTGGEVTLRGADGRTFQAYVNQSVVRNGPGGLRTRSVVRDLTPEREWERALRESEQQFQRIFEDAPVGIALLDLEGRIVQCNGAFRAMVTDGQAGIVGARLPDMVGEQARVDVATALEAALAGENSADPIEIHPGGERSSALYLSAITDGSGNMKEVIAHCLDTTQQRNLEIQFAQSQKMQAVGQLAGGMAHDFNNLLTAMIGFCDLLLLRHRPGQESFADIMQIKQNANRAASLVRQLLAFSRQQTLKPKILNLTDVLAELTHLLRRLVGENIDVRMVHGRDLGLVRVDQGQIEQVIINLVVNARDAMPEGGEVTIRTANVSNDDPMRLGHEMLPPGDYVLVEVIDQGEGISKENIGRIFEPFFSTKEVGAGTGLGLSTVYGIVKQTGGFIFVDSEEGKGARFSVFLPRHTPREDEAGRGPGEGEAERPRDLTGAGTVLLVEDEHPVRLFSARALRNKGYTVLEAESGEAAMNLLADGDQRIDLLITDVVMPRMDGPSLIREVRQRRPDIKVICISGYAEDAFRRKLDGSADIHFLPKPFSLNQLAGKVKEVLRAPVA